MGATIHLLGFPDGSVVKNLPARQVWSLGWEDPLVSYCFCISLHIYPKDQEELPYQPSFQSPVSFLKKKIIVIILLFLLEDNEGHLLVYNLNCPVKDRTFLPKDSMLPYLEESSYLLHCSMRQFFLPRFEIANGMTFGWAEKGGRRESRLWNCMYSY